MAYDDEKKDGEEIIRIEETTVEQQVTEEDITLAATAVTASSDQDKTLVSTTTNRSNGTHVVSVDGHKNGHEAGHITNHHEHKHEETPTVHHEHKREEKHADDHCEETPATTRHKHKHEQDDASDNHTDKHARVSSHHNHHAKAAAVGSASGSAQTVAAVEDDKEQVTLAATAVEEKVLTTNTVVDRKVVEEIILPARKRRSWLWLPLLLLLLLALLVWLLLSTWTAKATVITNTQTYSNLRVINQQAQSFSQQGHQQVSITVPPTFVPGKPAFGTLTFHNASVTCGCITIPAGTVFQASNGISVVTDAAAQVGAQCTVTVPAHTLQIGPASNIPAFAVHTTYLNTISVNNTAGFVGGHAPSSISVVQQSTIDNAEKTLITQLQKTVPPAFQTQIAKQGFSILATACETHTLADHKAGDIAQSITVQADITCNAQGYNPEQAKQQALAQLEQEARNLFGSDYSLAGNPASSVKNATLIDPNKGTVQVIVYASGTWSYQFQQQQKQLMAQFIAGHTISDVQSFLQHQKGVSAVHISTSGILAQIFPSVLPFLPGHITLS